MRGPALVAALGALAQAPTPLPTLGPISTYAEYGPAEPIELAVLADGDETHQGKRILTKAELRPLASTLEYSLLVEGTARVLVIPVPELADVPRRLYGRRVEVTGVVRALPPSQRTVVCRGTLMLDSKCSDPDLPPLPDARIGWPPISLTVITISDIGPAPVAAPEADDGVIESLATSGASMVGQQVTIVGRFSGRDLFGQLASGSAPTPAAWALTNGTHAVWITGRKPEGRGWRLDPAYKGDAVRWLQVSGRVESVRGVAIVRASTVSLVSAPKSAPPEP